jgi:hypothetical protein
MDTAEERRLAKATTEMLVEQSKAQLLILGWLSSQPTLCATEDHSFSDQARRLREATARVSAMVLT